MLHSRNRGIDRGEKINSVSKPQCPSNKLSGVGYMLILSPINPYRKPVPFKIQAFIFCSINLH